jgi:vacuolar protein sorting-associated protein 13A/C
MRNETGYPIFIWNEVKGDKTNTLVFKMDHGESRPWKFDDWNVKSTPLTSQDHKLSIQLDGPSWESVKQISLSKVGIYTYQLLPRINNVAHILTCSVSLKDKVKIVTFRSPNQIFNSTSIAIQVMSVNDQGAKVGSIIDIAPGSSISIAVGSAYFNFARLRPKGFDYGWSPPIGWLQLGRDKSFLATCDSGTTSGAPFNFQVVAEPEGSAPKGALYPMISMRIKSPIQIHNLLPVNIKYLVYDKDLKQSHIDTLNSGAVSSLNLVNPTHLLGLSIQIIGQRFKQSDVALISNSDLELRDDKISIKDADGRNLILGLDYNDECIDCGLKISIYCPYIILNRTGLDLFVRSKSLLDTSAVGQVRKVSNPMDKIIDPYLFSYPKVDSLRNRVQISVDECKSWCKPFSLDATGTSLDLSIPFEKHAATVHLGVKIQEGEGKVIIILPNI